MLPIFKDLLRQYWGYDSFRPMQEEIITSIYRGNDTLGLLPTGGGKSITFQLPALLMEGLCIIVTPLIALMKDQVNHLREKGIKATAIYSGMTTDEIVCAIDHCIYGNCKFLYLSPERLCTEIFLSKLPEMSLSLLVVDEAHCISQWGYDFRPSYLRIAEIREYFPAVPVLALTATATPEVVDDIQAKLHFKAPNVFKTSFKREELVYWAKESNDKNYDLLSLFSRMKEGGSTIVYVRNRKKTKEIAEILLHNGFKATYYHAGLDSLERDRRQREWQEGKVQIVVCTNAFGMGIDKPDVRLVIHLDIPDSLEAYFQEAGRAGRDRQKSTAVLLYGKRDKLYLKKGIEDRFPPREYVRNVYDRLAYYLQVAEGEGYGCVFDFNLGVFCKNNHFPLLPTFHALKLLEQAGYIELTDERDNASRILFVMDKEELYHCPFLDKRQEALIALLLRTYTGVFTDYVYINEELLSQRLQMPMNELYQQLLLLSRMRVIHYIPRKQTPFIIYSQRRIDSKYIVIPSEIYEERKVRYAHRVDEICRYVYSSEVCRSRFLLAYFGEKRSTDCGQCDVCRKKNKYAMPPDDLIKIQIVELLKGSTCFVSQLLDQLPFERTMLLPVIRKMLEDDVLLIKNGSLSLVDE